MNLTIVGGGVMGEVMTASILKSGILTARFITIVDLNRPRLTQLRRRYNVQAQVDIQQGIKNAEIVILAVKPQQSREVMEQVAGVLSPNALVLSIMAGVSLKTLRASLKHTRVIRSMPNTPAQLQEGMTVWMATKQVNSAQKKCAQTIFSTFGKQLEVKKEDLIDAATAVSGSGPAYVFNFAEHLIAAGCKLGFSKEQAMLLVKQTIRGAALLLDESEDDAATLREKVTSKKGTTEAALNVFRRERLGERISRGLTAAYKRAKELSQM